ncbi:MAG: glycoside hydrolase family 97 C-terminal domain-containing protein [Bacteroidales bacterium]|nr:glycoside hydrolase family 97 C-terminal domain-containing protein [Bacteroidales bacterium]
MARFERPMSIGTRCHQLAMYVVFESPLQMLADNPTNYRREAECTRFISKIPTVWDETVVLDARVGEYILLARRRWDTWYIGAMTNSEPRDLELDLSFLPGGSYTLEQFADGINADRNAQDYKRTEIQVVSGQKLKIHLAPGGGWAGKI